MNFKMLRIKFYDWIGVQWNAAYFEKLLTQIKIQSSKRRNSIVFVSNNFTGISIALCWNFVLFFLWKHCFLLIIGVLIPNRYSATLRIRWLWCFSVRMKGTTLQTWARSRIDRIPPSPSLFYFSAFQVFKLISNWALCVKWVLFVSFSFQLFYGFKPSKLCRFPKYTFFLKLPSFTQTKTLLHLMIAFVSMSTFCLEIIIFHFVLKF